MSTRYLRDGRAPIPEKEVTSKIMSSIRAKNTKPEIALRKALHASGLSGYRLHWKKAPGKPDITYPGRKLAIFVNGCYWHRCPHCNPPFPKTHQGFWEEKFRKNTERDLRKVEQLEQQGWKVIVIWECQIRDNLQICVDMIRSFLLKY
jgi:DNA mismatch endonuclease, patch repair protein